MWNILFVTAILLSDAPAGDCMFLGIDCNFLKKVFLCAAWIHVICTQHSSHSSNFVFSQFE